MARMKPYDLRSPRVHPLRSLLFALFAALLLTSAAPAAARAPAAPAALPRITVAGDRLMLGELPFELRGVNYTHATTTPAGCPELHFGADGRCPWDQAAIDADFARLQALGVNAVRVFINYYVFGGARAIDASYDLTPALEHLDALIASANRHGLYVMPVLLAKYPQDQLTPAGFARALELHVRPVVSHLAGHPGILAWDLFNEPDIGSPIDQRCWDWDNGDFPLCARLAAQRIAFLEQLYYEVTWLDPQQLTTIGMAFAKSYFRPAAVPSPLAGLVDFYSFHYYDDDPYDSGRYDAHWYYGDGLPRDLQRSIAELRALSWGKPVVVSEFGFPTGPDARRDEAGLRRDLRTGLRAIRASGGSGVMLWPFQSSPEELVGDLFTAAD